MQFIQSGPDIPDSLLQVHEEGQVIFFCGAGISYPAGLPGFKGLVDKIYREVGTERNTIEKLAYQNDQYDATLDLLERRLPSQRREVRTALANTLIPKLRRKGALDTHSALLKLACNRDGDGYVRLVTTNFDRIFQYLIKKNKLAINTYQAPLLPVPKSSRWNGIVYLHGLLPAKPEENELNKLVLTSGDFGRAYLTERWAARFVSELFRNYMVCFIGYSINDPVLRYMMDALAADRMLGEATFPTYALGACESGQENIIADEWEAKGVIPILYEIPQNTDDHSALHCTLAAWAETYNDGVQGKERVVVSYAMTRPSASTQQDDFVGRMLWALSDNSGLPAKRFAELDPVPPIDWLNIFSNDYYYHNDLSRFSIQPLTDSDDSQLDDVMFHLARWLTRHLNDPELILWLAKYGGKLHKRFTQLIEGELDKLAQLEQAGNQTELNRIQTNAPNAIPCSRMRTLWSSLFAGQIKPHWHNNHDLFHWMKRLNRDGFTTALRLELRRLFAPKIMIRKPFKWGVNVTETEDSIKHKQLVDCELVLTADHVFSVLDQLRQSEVWNSALPDLFDDFQQLVRDALDLFRELGEADDQHDRSYNDLPSIGLHWHNRGFHDWVVLIEILRDAWVAISQIDLHRARYIVQGWLTQPYPTFRRLALFAATHEGIATDDEWVSWLLENDNWWLWSTEVQRETMRLLALQNAKLKDVPREQLEAAILAEPPRNMFSDKIESEHLQWLVDRAVWLRLAKLSSGNYQLGVGANLRFAELTKKYPELKLADNEQDEFPFWVSGTSDPDYENRRVIDKAPRKRRELIDWLQRERTGEFFYEDDWNEVCREYFPVSACALIDLACHNNWPIGRWRSALQTWSSESLTYRSWRYIAPILKKIPGNELIELASSVAWWLEASAKTLKQHEEIFLELCRRILELNYQDSIDKNRITMQAINHPVGQVTQAILHYWFRREPNDNEELPNDVKPLLSSLFNKDNTHYRHARVILAAHLIALFRVDREWTSQFLLPLFDWETNNEEALAVWEGFLWSPRLYRPLLSTLKVNILDTAKHYSEFEDVYGQQYATFLTYVALDHVDTFTIDELRGAFSVLPVNGLRDSAQALVNALKSAGEQREQYWINRIKPFWREIWPKSRAFISGTIAEPLAQLLIAAQDKFPEALSTVRDWLMPLKYPHYIVHTLQKSDLSARFPEDALSFLDAIMNHESYPPTELNECLKSIDESWPGAQKDKRYQEMLNYLQKWKQ